MKDEIREILDRLDYNEWEVDLYKVPITWCELYDIRDYITNLQKENERLNKEVAKLHIIQEEYGSHIENTHIIDDYQKTYFMTNKWLIELKDGKFVDINVLNSDYEDYKSRVEKAVEYIKTKGLKEEEWQNNFCIKATATYTREEIFDLLNILQNGSDSE